MPICVLMTVLCMVLSLKQCHAARLEADGSSDTLLRARQLTQPRVELQSALRAARRVTGAANPGVQQKP